MSPHLYLLPTPSPCLPLPMPLYSPVLPSMSRIAFIAPYRSYAHSSYPPLFCLFSVQTLGYNYGLHASPDYPSIPCYMADRDIVIPPVSVLSNEEIPLDGKNITVLFRFRPKRAVTMSHHNHWVRKEIFDVRSHLPYPSSIPLAFSLALTRVSGWEWDGGVGHRCMKKRASLDGILG